MRGVFFRLESTYNGPMSNKLRLSLTLVFSAFAAGSAYLGFMGQQYGPLQQSANAIYASWMADVSDTTALRDLAIPGSHDTMALYSIGDLAGQCQTLSLKDQLGIGVRFLDIRLQLENNKLKAVHGIVDQKASFASIVSDVDAFLRQNPKEFLIVSIKEEADAKNSTISFEQAIKETITANWDTSLTLPSTVGEARGKAHLFSRYAGSTLGVPAYEGWADSASFTLPNGIYVQDTYKTDVTKKKTEIVSCFEEKGHALKINFLSGYSPNGFPPSYAPSIANAINPWIDENIHRYDDRGIVLYDFVDTISMKAFFGGNKK